MNRVMKVPAFSMSKANFLVVEYAELEIWRGSHRGVMYLRAGNRKYGGRLLNSTPTHLQTVDL